MDNPSSLRSRWNEGILLLIGSALPLWLMYKLVDFGMGWLVQEADELKMSPVAGVALEVTAWIVLAPILFAVWLQFSRHTLVWLFKQVCSLWLWGFKFGAFCALIALPCFALQQVAEYFVEGGVLGASPQVKASLKLLVIATWVFLAPFWTLPLYRWLFRTALGRAFFESFRKEKVTAEG